MSYHSVNTPIGILCLKANNNAITNIYFGRKSIEDSANNLPPVLFQCEEELSEYFSGKRIKFNVNVHPDGTDFQRRVWDELKNVKYSQTKSYRQIAEAIGSRAYRAVGTAIGSNPIPIIIPCHRIINANGQLGGYAGGVNVKEKLLRIEGSTISMAVEYTQEHYQYRSS